MTILKNNLLHFLCTEILENGYYDIKLEFDYEMTDLASFDTHLSLFKSEIQLSSYVEGSSMEKYNGTDSTDITIVRMEDLGCKTWCKSKFKSTNWSIKILIQIC